jgi:hypothetical protein
VIKLFKNIWEKSDRDPFRIKLWWVPTKKLQVPLKHSLLIFVVVKNVEFQTQIMSPGLAYTSYKYALHFTFNINIHSHFCYTTQLNNLFIWYWRHFHFQEKMKLETSVKFIMVISPYTCQLFTEALINGNRFLKG